MNKPTICKSCGRLMGTADICPYCGAKRSSLKTNIIYLKRKISAPGYSYFNLILKVTIGMYILEVLAGMILMRSGIVETIISGPPGQILYLLGASSPGVFSHGHWWGPFTANFLHGGIMHIGFNMFALSQIGPLIEQATTRAFFLFCYLMTGVGGFLLSAYGGSLSVGASASLYGLIGCGIVISFILGQGKDDPLFRGLITWLIYGIIFSLFFPGIDHLAHLGGLISGLAFGYIWTKMRMVIWFRGLTEKASLMLAGATVIGFIHCLVTFL